MGYSTGTPFCFDGAAQGLKRYPLVAVAHKILRQLMGKLKASDRKEERRKLAAWGLRGKTVSKYATLSSAGNRALKLSMGTCASFYDAKERALLPSNSAHLLDI